MTNKLCRNVQATHLEILSVSSSLLGSKLINCAAHEPNCQDSTYQFVEVQLSYLQHTRIDWVATVTNKTSSLKFVCKNYITHCLVVNSSAAKSLHIHKPGCQWANKSSVLGVLISVLLIQASSRPAATS